MSNPTAVFEPLPNSSAGNPTTFYVVRFNLEPGQLQIPRAGAGTSLFLREDGTWATPPGGSATVYRTTVQLDSTALIALDGTPVEIVPAQGAGKVILPFLWSLNYVAGGTPYTTGTGSFLLRYVGAGSYLTYANETMIEGGDQFFLNDPVDSTFGKYSDTTGVDNVALEIYADEPIADGDGTLDVTVWYVVQDL